MSQFDSAHEHLIEMYRKTARHYDITSQLSPFGPQRKHRRMAVQALQLKRPAFPGLRTH